MERIYNYFNSNDIERNICNKKIVELNSLIKKINSEYDINSKEIIKIPKLVVVGSQSSGKSTLLNRIIGINILPVGHSMQTRTPINIELKNSKNNYLVEFGRYRNNNWIVNKRIEIKDNITEHQQNEIREKIEKETNIIAGNTSNISFDQINIRIESPYVPDLNFIDLPGLTMIACTDRGQPKDIKDQIRNLIIKYIENKENLILSIIPSREDIETDIGLELVKNYDKKGERTIGVLTKVDLMIKTSNISNYILNKISQDLKLKYGYFVIKNDNNINLGLENMALKEEEYFKNHNVYNKLIHINRFGIKNLCDTLSKIFIENIKKSIPYVLDKINNMININEDKIKKLGIELPNNEEIKVLKLSQHFTNISSNINDNIDKKCNLINTGRLIKDEFLEFKTEINNINPFNKENCSDKILENIIKNSEGNHMSFPIPTIEILELCLNNKEIASFNKFIEIVLECNNNISEKLINLLDVVLCNEGLNNYKDLYNKLKINIINNVIEKNKKKCREKLIEYIDIERNYIWTDNKNFNSLLREIPKNLLDIDILRKLLNEYFNNIKYIINHNIPKIIMFLQVLNFKKEIHLYLLNQLHKNNYLELYEEDSEIKDNRKKINNLIKSLYDCKNLLEDNK